MVLSTALFNKPAFKSLVCNGLVLADDGKKMSKRLKNYPVSSPFTPRGPCPSAIDKLQCTCASCLLQREPCNCI